MLVLFFMFLMKLQVLQSTPQIITWKVEGLLKGVTEHNNVKSKKFVCWFFLREAE